MLHLGDPADEPLVLVEGSASVVLPRPDAPALRLSGVRDGTTIGEIGILERAARSADVVADTPVRVLGSGARRSTNSRNATRLAARVGV